MDHAETIRHVKKVNTQIKTLIEQFCTDLSSITIENDFIVRDSVNIEQIRQALNELALLDPDLIFDREIIKQWMQENAS